MSWVSQKKAMMSAEDLHINDILCLDGILNKGDSHDASFQGWRDLSGNGRNFVKASGSNTLTWGSDHVVFNGTPRLFFHDTGANTNIFSGHSSATIELVYEATGRPSYQGSDGYYGCLYKNGGDGVWDTYIGLWQWQSTDGTTNGQLNRVQTKNPGYLTMAAGKHYIAIVLEADGTSLYRDGSFIIKATTAPFNASGMSRYHYIGYSYNLSRYPYCNMHRLGISGHAMTASEIAERWAYFQRRFNII